MTIEEGKAALDAGHTLELDLPARWKYIAANYHALINAQKQYICSVYYEGVSTGWEPLFASTDWPNFFSHLPPVLQYSTEWIVM